MDKVLTNITRKSRAKNGGKINTATITTMTTNLNIIIIITTKGMYAETAKDKGCKDFYILY